MVSHIKFIFDVHLYNMKTQVNHNPPNCSVMCPWTYKIHYNIAFRSVTHKWFHTMNSNLVCMYILYGSNLILVTIYLFLLELLVRGHRQFQAPGFKTFMFSIELYIKYNHCSFCSL